MMPGSRIDSRWLIIFSVVLSAELVAVYLNNRELQFVFKPLLMPVLAGYFYSSLKPFPNKFKKWLFAALFFSWAGDVLLMFVEEDPNFFLAGLSSFLLAHIFYIILFHNIRIAEGIRSRILPLIIVVAYYSGLIVLLSPYLGEMKLPVRIYGIVISFMFMLAVHMLFIRNRKAGSWMMIGALLFILSDSILAINKFYQPFELAGILIMITYGLAQLFIVQGAIKYIREENNARP